MKRFKLYIFDLDGTLIDSLNDLKTAINYSFRTLGFEEKTVEEVKKAVGYGSVKLISDLLPDDVSEDVRTKAFDIYLDYYNKNCYKETIIYDGVFEIFDILKERENKIALLTNKPSQPTEILVDKLGFSKYFDMVVAGDTYELRKPDPYGINKILEKLNIDKQDAVMIGDSYPDVQAAKSAGVFSVGIVGGYDTQNMKPDLEIGQIKDLLPII